MNKRVSVAENIGGDKEKKMMRQFKLHHRMIFAFIVFVGVVLLWSGVWDLVSMIPIVNDPYVSTGLGLVILIVTGTYYNNTI